MAYIGQKRKRTCSKYWRAVLKKYGMKGTIGIDNHRGLKVNLKEGVIDFGETNYQVNTYHIDKFHKGVAAEFLNELVAAMKGTKWYNNTNAMIDYFDIAYYVYINIGKWDNPYVVLKGKCIMTMHTTGLTQEQINTLMKDIPTYYDIDINTLKV